MKSPQRWSKAQQRCGASIGTSTLGGEPSPIGGGAMKGRRGRLNI